MPSFKIVADSSSDLFEFNDVPFGAAPLKIITAEKEYIDNASLDVSEMVDDLLKYKGKSSTSCPNPEDWIEAFGDADRVFCITITGTLSGAYNSAKIAKQMYGEMHPDRKVYVFNSLTTGPEMKLIIEKISEMIIDGKDYDYICENIPTYAKKTGLLFVLESMRNLANNGRVSPIVAKAAGLLGIRVIGRASDKGDLQQLDKCRGQERVVSTIINRLKEFGFSNGKVRIAHCLNLRLAEELKSRLLREFDKAKIEIYNCRGLCSFYAEKGGLLIGFEGC